MCNEDLLTPTLWSVRASQCGACPGPECTFAISMQLETVKFLSAAARGQGNIDSPPAEVRIEQPPTPSNPNYILSSPGMHKSPLPAGKSRDQSRIDTVTRGNSERKASGGTIVRCMSVRILGRQMKWVLWPTATFPTRVTPSFQPNPIAGLPYLPEPSQLISRSHMIPIPSRGPPSYTVLHDSFVGKQH